MSHPCSRLRPAIDLISQYGASSRLSSMMILHRTVPNRLFTSTTSCASHIGSAPLSIPESVTLNVLPPVTPKSNAARNAVRQVSTPTVEILGPLGKLEMSIPNYVKLDQDEVARKVSVSINDRTDKKQRSMWGTTRAYLANHIFGVSEGHTTLLRLVGVGYRASIESSATTISPTYPDQKFVNLKVGYSHPIELGVPKGVTASTPQPTRILLEGTEKEVINQFAARIRKWRVPEPYKGKGIFVNSETITLKAKKIK